MSRRNTRSTAAITHEPATQEPKDDSPSRLPGEEEEKVNYVNWAEVNENNIHFLNIDKVSISKPGETPISCNSIPVRYNYGDESEEVLDRFLVESPVLFFPKGIGSSVQNGKTNWSLRTVFNPNKQDHTDFMNMIYTKMYQPSVEHCHPLRVRLGVEGLNLDNPTVSGFKFFISKSRDKDTREIIESSPYSWFMNLVPYGENKTKFITALNPDEKPKPIAWSLLEGVKCEGIAVFEYKAIWNGSGKLSMQVKVSSVIITRVQKDAPIANLDTARSLAMHNPNQAGSVMNTLIELKETQEDDADPNKIPSSSAPQASAVAGASTFAGIPGIPNMSSARASASVAPSMSSMQNFMLTAGTPSASTPAGFAPATPATASSSRRQF